MANIPAIPQSSSERTPLIPDRREAGDDDNAADTTSPPPGSSRLREIILFVWALLATAAVVVLAVWTQHRGQTRFDPPADAKRNLIFMVSDGMGPASLSLTRSFRQHVEGLPEGDVLTLDRHFWGSSRTRSSNSLVTDSAAGATAFSCGKKSYNGAISVLPDYEPCGTVLEAAKRAGFMTGLVVTTDITDATPACFASHVITRAMNDDIALQEVGDGPLGRVVDIMLGGGRCHFLPNGTEGSCRLDDTDVVARAQEKFGWTYAGDRKAFDALEGGEKVNFPTFGLFAPGDIPFEIDRRNMSDVYPSLSEMAATALRALEKATENSDQGFFLMIEGSRIDHAGHINDPAAQVREVLEYDKAFKLVSDFVKDSKTESLLVATSDHETGGLATALQEPGHLPVYNWYPKALAKATASAEHLSKKFIQHVASSRSQNKDELKAWVNKKLVVPGLGIEDAHPAELQALVDHPEASVLTFAAMISLRAHVGWSTHGHTALDVNVYSTGGDEAQKIRGNIENTEIGKFLRGYLNVDVDAITEELKEKMNKKQLGVMSVDMQQMPALAEDPNAWSQGQEYAHLSKAGAA
ncbi:Putative alkaline phosphatase, alkaline-phosphatase-like, core domain superfamily [Colletotrichum destructivum]|uniref:Alkaline phosphatase n=1 Tax=Colletotrichum destructivum TaxID=34406 RepID=A0AAX4HWF6_9PEZI|nr:Putative alkaline phosphatase, alkaline-phosphatase-like, core domain superfamily [Colletotrichum destructivum]